MLAHQRMMGVTTTILLPAGRPLNYGSTHYGVSNGLQVKAGGNETCYQYAREHSSEMLFGACEVPVKVPRGCVLALRKRQSKDLGW